MSQSTDANQSREKNIFQDPFWSIYWPGGQVLTRFILGMGIKLLSDKSVENSRGLDLGSGCGASAIAAKLVGARQVLAHSIDEVACLAILMNAKLNNVDLQVSKENVIEGTLNELFNVILIGDLLYGEEIAEKLIPCLERSSRTEFRINLGDPGRHGLTEDLKNRMTPIFKYDLPENVKEEITDSTQPSFVVSFPVYKQARVKFMTTYSYQIVLCQCHPDIGTGEA